MRTLLLLVSLVPAVHTNAKIPLRAFVDLSESDNATATATKAMLHLAQFVVNSRQDDADVLLATRDLYAFEKNTVFWNLNNLLCEELKTGFMMMLAGTRTHTFGVYHSIATAMQVPLIDWEISDLRAPDLETPTPMTFSVYPPVEPLLLDYIKYKRWKDIVYIHDGENSRRSLNALYALIEERNRVPGAKIMELRVEPVRAPIHEEFFRDFISTFHRTRAGATLPPTVSTANWSGIEIITAEPPFPRPLNVIVDLEGAYRIQSFLHALEESVLVTRHFNYVFANYHLGDADLSAFRYTLINITTFQIFDAADKEFVRIKKLYEQGYKESRERIENVPPSAALAHDAVLVAAAAANIALRDHGRDLFKNTYRDNHQLFNNNSPGIYCNPILDDLNVGRPFEPFEFGKILAQSIRKVVLGPENGTRTGRIEFDPRTGLRRNFTATVVELRPGQNNLNSIVERFGWRHSEWPLLGFESERIRQQTASLVHTRPNQHVYKVISVLVKPFVMLKRPTGNRTLKGNDMYEGFCVDLLNKLAENMSNFRYEIHISEGNQYGKKQADGSWDGMIGYVLNGSAQMAVAPLTINQERERVVDFTKPFMSTGISIMIQKPEKQEFSIFSFMQPLGTTIWVLTLCSYVGVSLTIFIVSTFSPYEQRQQLVNPASQDYAVTNDFSLYNSLWFTLAAFMQQGTDILPKAPSGRMASSCWWFFTLIIVSSYTANLAAFLTLEKMTPPIESVDDLARQTDILYGTMKAGSTRNFFEDSAVPLYRKMYDFMVKTHRQRTEKNLSAVFYDTYDQGIERVRKDKGRYAFLLEETTNNYENMRKPCNTMKVGYNLNTIGYGIATKIGNPLRSDLNLAVLYLHEKGELKKLEDKWWYDRGQCDAGGMTESADSGSLTLSKVAGIFYILSAGMALSMLTALVEFLFRKRIETRDNAKNRHQARRNLRRDLLSVEDRSSRPARSRSAESTPGGVNPAVKYF